MCWKDVPLFFFQVSQKGLASGVSPFFGPENEAQTKKTERKWKRSEEMKETEINGR